MKRSRRLLRHAQRGSVGSPPPSDRSSARDLDSALAELEHRVQQLRVDVDQILHQDQLQEQLASYGQGSTQHRAEIQALQSQIDAIEAEFIGRFLSWQHLREPFWQAVRFGGGGLVLGFLLRGCTGS